MVTRLMLVTLSEQLICLMHLVLAHLGCSAITDNKTDIEKFFACIT